MEEFSLRQMHYMRTRRFFNQFNRYFMVPLFRLGLGLFIGNPLLGYVMVIRTLGRKTGKAIYTPVNYAIMDGDVYCLSGWGDSSHWYRNLLANPRVELLMPGGRIQAVAWQVTDADQCSRIVRQVLKNSGFAALFLGINPYLQSDEILREKTRDSPVVRLVPTGLETAPTDPGGWFWLVLMLGMAWLWYGRRKRQSTEVTG